MPIDPVQAWVVFLQEAQLSMAQEEIFTSPVHKQGYKIERINPESVHIQLLSGGGSVSVGFEKFTTCIDNMNHFGFPIVVSDVYGNRATVSALVAMLPELDWSDEKDAVIYDEESPVKMGEPPVPNEASNGDIGKRMLVWLKRRQGQKKLRDKLLTLYKGECAISICTIPSVLHACHIFPYAETGLNISTNAILLRSDLHDLFDSNLLAIHPETYKVHLHPTVQVHYSGLNEKINARVDRRVLNPAGLALRWERFQSW